MNDYQHQFKELYINTAREYIKKISSALQVLQTSLTDEQSIEELYISFHSLGTQSFVMGYERLGAFCRTLEQVFKEVKEKRRTVDVSFVFLVQSMMNRISLAIELVETSNLDTDFTNEQAQIIEKTV